MSLQFEPALSHCCHWYENVGPSAHTPGSAVSVSPTTGLPEIVGFEVFRGAAFPEITSLGFEIAVAEPSALRAVTCTRTVLPTSASVSLYVVFVWPAMSPQESPSRVHRCHWYE